MREWVWLIDLAFVAAFLMERDAAVALGEQARQDHANSVKGQAVSLVERAIALQVIWHLTSLKKHGSWHQAGPARLLIAKPGRLMITPTRTPFQERLPVSAEVEYGAKPFAIDVWHKEKSVLFVEWDDDGATDVVWSL